MKTELTKKVLSMLLALAMLLSLGVAGANASGGESDLDESQFAQYKEILFDMSLANQFLPWMTGWAFLSPDALADPCLWDELEAAMDEVWLDAYRYVSASQGWESFDACAQAYEDGVLAALVEEMGGELVALFIPPLQIALNLYLSNEFIAFGLAWGELRALERLVNRSVDLDEGQKEELMAMILEAEEVPAALAGERRWVDAYNAVMLALPGLRTAVAAAQLAYIAQAAPTYTLTYNLAGGFAGPVVQAGIAEGAIVPLSGVTPLRWNYTFIGWSAIPYGTTIQSIALYEDTTVYAVWEKNSPAPQTTSGAEQPTNFLAVFLNMLINLLFGWLRIK
ncbi:MAG: InlB B-repeat-containing protein [Oscillospiraceae bacterium]|jgi:hypothetical protein|nr:InlB B-repeat-containing protein [Oscillospiraceae bacterium]